MKRLKLSREYSENRGEIMKKSLFLFFLSAVFLTAALFAEGETTETASQQENKQEEAKAEETAEPQAQPAAETEAAPQEEAKPEENAGSQSESAPAKDNELEAEEAAAIQSESVSEVVEIEVVENEGKFIFSARSLDKMTWNEAQDYCKKLDSWGETWRLPNIDELRELVRNCPATEPGGSCRVSEEGNCIAGNCSSPKNSCTCERQPKNRGFYSMFGDADYIGLWSSSTLSNDDKKAWGAVFYSGMIGSLSKDAKLYARCVARSDQNFLTEEKKKEKTDKKDEKADKKLETGLSDKDINEQFDKKMKDFSLCIYKGTREDKDMTHGRVTIDYIISPTGEVIYSGVQMSTFGNLTVENCVANMVREMKFPAPKHGATISAAHSILFFVKRK